MAARVAAAMIMDFLSMEFPFPTISERIIGHPRRTLQTAVHMLPKYLARASIGAFILILRHRGFKIVLGGVQGREFGRTVFVTFAVGHAPSVMAQRAGNVALGRIVVLERVPAFVGVASCRVATQRQENSASHGGRPNTHCKPPNVAGERAF